jgi:hypothetical protein
VAPILTLAAVVALALSGVVDPLQSGALTMLPALALALVMLIRPYLGQRVIARLRRDRLRRAAPRGPAVAHSPRPAARVARGGRLIAVSLAGRAPPPALAGCR